MGCGTEPEYAILSDNQPKGKARCFTAIPGQSSSSNEPKPFPGNYLRTLSGQGYREAIAWFDHGKHGIFALVGNSWLIYAMSFGRR
jgi:hypothetical protein